MLKVHSEVGRLRRVVVQRPGTALERMLPEHIVPSSSRYLLFDDLVDVRQAGVEHDALCKVLGSVAEVLHFDQLLTETLADAERRTALIGEVAELEGLNNGQAATMEALDAEALAATMIVGTEGGLLDAPALFEPAPNLIFTRDLAAVVGEVVVVGNASKAARLRETLLAWAVVDGHPLFADAQVARGANRVAADRGSGPLTIEGGDVLVVSDSLVCIGASERTSWAMIVSLSEELLDAGFSRILVVEMPKKRSSMHLDTVFTMVNWDTGVVYPPLLQSGGRDEACVLRLRRVDDGVAVDDLDMNLLDALSLEGHPLQAIFCGGGHPVHAPREQWTDGANYLALGPGVVVGYARNYRTAQAMEERGYTVMDPEAFLNLLATEFQGDADALFASNRQIAVHLVGSELSRGRGGPRCLTFPLWRDG